MASSVSRRPFLALANWLKEELLLERSAFVHICYSCDATLTVEQQGLNTKAGFDVKIAKEIANLTGLPFETAPNKVMARPCHSRVAETDPVLDPSSKPWRLMTPLWKHMEH